MSTTADGEASGTEGLKKAMQERGALKARLLSLKTQAENLEHTYQETGERDHHTLGENMVSGLGLRCWSSVVESLEAQQNPLAEVERNVEWDDRHPILAYPRALLDCLVHLSEYDDLRMETGDFEGLPRQRRQFLEWIREEDEDVAADLRIGGTDYLAYGPKGSGKSTWALTWVARLLEINQDAVVWRGTSARSEWLPLAPWTTLVLPKGVDVTVELEPPRDDWDTIEVEPEAIAGRGVKRYTSPREINHELLEEGAFHVVYPDPKFRECDRITQRADEIGALEHVSAWDARDDGELGPSDVTPLEMWWFAWIIGKIEFGPPIWTSWICDEIGSLLPEGASNSYHDHWDRIDALKTKYVDARRNRLSMFGFGHEPEDVHSMIRKKMRWRITMNGMSNPTSKTTGMGEPPMQRDYTGHYQLGDALAWNSQHFAPISWGDLPADYKIPGQLHVRYPGYEEVLSSC